MTRTIAPDGTTFVSLGVFATVSGYVSPVAAAYLAASMHGVEIDANITARDGRHLALFSVEATPGHTRTENTIALMEALGDDLAPV